MQIRVRDPTAIRALAAQALTLALAAALIAFAVLADRAWLYRHTLPEFFQPRADQLRTLAIVRTLAGSLAAILLLVVRPRFGRLMARKRFGDLAADLAPTAAAIVLALVASELILEHLPWRLTHQAPGQREPLRRRDPYLGWSYVPNHAGQGVLGGRAVDYAFDAAGHRIRRAGEAVDYGAPSILFLGESIMAGHGLTWSESIPAQVQAATGLQGADLAVGGYATDQQYLRLKAELPRFRQPRAVVFLFMPALYHRNLDTDRPHLVPGLAWRPSASDLRLRQLASRLVPYRSARELADGEAMTAQTLAAAVDLARARGAVPLILVPQLTPETAEEAALRRRLLDARRLPYLQVAVDPAFHIPHDRHPDPRGARAIAGAVTAWLRRQGVAPPVARGLQETAPAALATGRRPRT
ncbi:hypothetical protein [Phenylobacterium sp.]|uniref:hypothetical protein n=1 Tax=Phenylobacterium sp. TaxID=1871053 RepID=UPI0025EDDF99|nr:hypothetical protein [Phenylobacterium sp.]